MIKADAAQWLGNRGHMIDTSDIIKCKEIGSYFFVITKEYPEEVELYDLNDMYAECIDCFPVKSFKWNKDFMRKCITGEI
tara:strand:- start:54 stop:293 length:240 start_codon:yes stop_codon:yes gene_type:complete